MTPDRIGLYRHGDCIGQRAAVELMALPAAQGWGVAFSGHYALEVVRLDLATREQQAARTEWTRRHGHEVQAVRDRNWKQLLELTGQAR